MMLDLGRDGERFTPEMQGAIRWEHLHRYAFASELVAGKDVVDVACGEGYGTKALSYRARMVTGIDISPDCIEHAQSTYRGKNVAFQVGSCLRLPLADASCDAIVSFETIEHLASPEGCLQQFRRVLKKPGLLIVSTPDSDFYPAGNPHHQKELTRGELMVLLSRNFAHVRLFGQRAIAGSCIAPLEPISDGKFMTWDNSGNSAEHLPNAMYLIAVCSDAPLPAIGFGIMENVVISSEIWRVMDCELANLRVIQAKWNRLCSTRTWRVLCKIRRLLKA